jgi:hypothetical protein
MRWLVAVTLGALVLAGSSVGLYGMILLGWGA